MINHRDQLPELLDRLNLTGIGVEVGVQYGKYSEHILLHSGLSLLISVDPWKHYADGYGNDSANFEQDKQDRIYAEACVRLEQFDERSVVLRMESQTAARLFAPGTFDVVYLDANHSYESVRDDIAAWWPLIKPGGVLAGHDYVSEDRKREIDRPYYGVKRAVDEFVQREGLELYITGEDYPTWIVVKGLS